MNRAFGAICLAALAVNMIAAPLAHATETAAATLGAGLSILDSESVIGYSQDGRPLVVQHLGDGGASVFVMGGQHGGPERNTVQLARLLFDHLAKNPDLIPQGLRLDFLIEANPDGLARGSRQFTSGVDPNRNWGGASWATDAYDSNGVFRLGLGGSEPFSEPETQATRDYILQTRPALVVNYHSRGGFLFGGRTDAVASAYSAASGYFIPGGGPAAGAPGGGGGGGSPLSYRATGAMNPWLGNVGIPGLLIELASSDNPEFARNLAALQVVLTMVGTSAGE